MLEALRELHKVVEYNTDIWENIFKSIKRHKRKLEKNGEIYCIMFTDENINFIKVTVFLQITLCIQSNSSYSLKYFFSCGNLQTDLKIHMEE